jgi:hypothetical protein
VKDKMSRGKNKQSDKETTDQENSENNSQLQSDRLEDAMGNEQGESGEKKRSGQSGSDLINRRLRSAKAVLDMNYWLKKPLPVIL